TSTVTATAVHARPARAVTRSRTASRPQAAAPTTSADRATRTGPMVAAVAPVIATRSTPRSGAATAQTARAAPAAARTVARRRLRRARLLRRTVLVGVAVVVVIGG